MGPEALRTIFVIQVFIPAFFPMHPGTVFYILNLAILQKDKDSRHCTGRKGHWEMLMRGHQGGHISFQCVAIIAGHSISCCHRLR